MSCGAAVYKLENPPFPFSYYKNVVQKRANCERKGRRGKKKNKKVIYAKGTEIRARRKARGLNALGGKETIFSGWGKGGNMILRLINKPPLLSTQVGGLLYPTPGKTTDCDIIFVK
jgi:hypothetical protein